MNKIKLSVLDQSPIRKGNTARQALLETVELAKLTDKLGYTRFWVSEHHNIESLAGSTPEVLIAHLAGETTNIRIGSGGIMLPNHSSLKVAENFRMLETLFPGRIDLGIGRAPGGDRLTSTLLNPSNNFSEEDFVQQLVDLKGFIHGSDDKGTIFEKVKAIPKSETFPDFWLLSSSGQSGIFAAHLGMAFSFAHFISPIGGPEAVHMYKKLFKPSESLAEPVANLALFVLCAETEEKANQLQKVMDFQFLNFERGIRNGFPIYEEIKDYQFSLSEMERVKFNRQKLIVGTPDLVKDKIIRVTERYGVDELVAVTITNDFSDRLKSYELLADAFKISTK